MHTELIYNTAVDLRNLIVNGEVSCFEVVRDHITHIEKVNPTVNAIVTECFAQALSQARAQDASPTAKHLPLAGLPIAHKDLVPTQGIRTTFGSTLFRDHIPEANDYIIDRIQAAGGISIGKTNVPEFGAGSHTYNRVFGPSHNPYDLTRTCGGSSGGAAVSLAVRMQPVADGSDLGGSLRNPAAFCNVIGFRPTNNVLPPRIDGENALNLAALGPMGRSIDDVHLLFMVLTGEATKQARIAALDPIDLTGLRIAYTKDFGSLPVVPEIRTQIDQVARSLEAAQAHVTEACPDLSGARDVFQTLRAVSFRNRYDGFSPRQKTELKPTILWNMIAGLALQDEDIARAQKLRKEIKRRVSAFFDDYDLLLGPTTQVLPFPIPVEWPREIEGVQMNTYIDWMESCSWITTTECPALSLPAGFSPSGLPIGAQLIAPIGEDSRLLRIAKSVETVISTASKLPPMLCGD